LARAFVQETHVTPAHFVELARLEKARRLLEETRLPVQRVALDSGFSGTQPMRKAFCRRLDSKRVPRTLSDDRRDRFPCSGLMSAARGSG
jgi:transcriptional regulator GlxA family with amidase domain